TFTLFRVRANQPVIGPAVSSLTASELGEWLTAVDRGGPVAFAVWWPRCGPGRGWPRPDHGFVSWSCYRIRPDYGRRACEVGRWSPRMSSSRPRAARRGRAPG